MTAPIPVDQVARDRIRDDLDATLFVEAGAGTGKTQSLVERIVRLLATGRATAASVAAITFTDAAAAELRGRVRGALEDASVAEGGDAEERERCVVALAELDAAALETLHSFCRRIVAAHALEAGLPPAFEVLDGTEAVELFDAQWDGWFDRALDDPALSTPLLRSFALGMRPGQLRDLASTLGDHWDRLEDYTPAEPDGPPAIDVESIAAEIDAVRALREHCVDPGDGLALHLDGLEAVSARLRSAGDELDALQALFYSPKLTSSRGKQQSWQKIKPAEIRETLKELQARRDALLDAVGSHAATALLAATRRFVLESAEERRRLGRLEFHDLLVRARDLLRAHGEVRRALRARFTHLLLDEFQDTDPIQIEVAALLGSDPPATSEAENRPWAELEIEPGRLFFVGDPKQSIYRFRRADIDLYRRVRERFGENRVSLTENFRSVPAVIDWANGVFGERFGQDGSGRQAPFEPLHASREGAGAAVYRAGGALSGSATAVRRTEATALAALLRRITAEGWAVTDGDTRRPATFADVAILSPTRTALSSLIEALEEAGIPHRVESRSLVFEAQEVRDLVAILRAIDDPTDEVALIAALRSPAFACGDDDLVRYASAGGRWDMRRDPPAEVAGGPVAAGVEWLRARHERRWWLPLASLIGGVIRDRRLLELAFVDRRPRERWQRLRFVAEQARAYAERPNATLRGLIDWLERQAEEGARVHERVAPEPDDDAVRIMTMHAAKGLEFPVVVLTGLNVASRHRPGSILWGADGQPEVRITDELATSGYEDLKTQDKLLDELERDRLLYVASTRARDHLVLSLYHPDKRAGDTNAARLLAFAEGSPDLCSELETEGVPSPAVPAAPAATGVEEAGERDAWMAARKELVASNSTAAVISATAMAKHLAGGTDPGLEKEEPSEETPPWRRGRAGSAIGRAVHSVLQTIDLTTGEGIENVAAAQAAAEGVPDRRDEVRRLARAALESAPVKEAVDGGRFWREVYVASEIDGVVVDGFVDLLYETADGYVVVDYKTDRLDASTLDNALARYRPQAATYALALSAQLERPVVRCLFVFVNAPDAMVMAVDDLEQAMAEVRGALALAVTRS